MDTKNVNEEILKNCYKNAKMALISLDEIIPKSSGKLKEELTFEYEEYNRLITEISLVAIKYGITLPEINKVEKTMLNASINLKTMADGSNSHIAEMNLKGTVTGYTTLIKDLSEYGPLLNKDVFEVVEKLKNFEEKCEDNLKKYL